MTPAHTRARGCALLLATVGATAFYVVAFRLGESGEGVPAFDVYGYLYPNILYALRSLASGGGLLWNPFQNCGQPFFAISSVGLLYPANVLFLLLDPSTALRVLLFVNLFVGGVGAWALLREIGVGTAAALGGTLAFMLGGTTVGVTVWTPIVQGPYVWLPATLLFCERLVRTGRLRDGVWLGIVLAMALLPGHPQFALFICQLVALRLLWGLGDASERAHLPRAAAAVALAFLLMLLLAAAQYLPATEVVAESVRGGSLLPEEIASGRMTWEGLSLGVRYNTAQVPFSLVPGFVVAAALADRDRRRVALFYTLAAALFLVLAFGDGTPVGRLYAHLPFGRAFRMPVRFAYVTGFCLSVLTGIAIDVLLRGRWGGVAAAAATLAACWAWAGGLSQPQWWLAAGMLAGGGVAVTAPARRVAATALVVGAVGLALVLVPAWTMQRHLPDGSALRAYADVFDRLRARQTSQDRVHLAPPGARDMGRDMGFVDKTASLFGLRAITDYEGQLTRTYAEYLTMLRSGQLLRNVNQVIYPGPWDPRTVRWPLLHLAAARYLAVAPEVDLPTDPARASLVPFDGNSHVHTYENLDALPRAYYVPRVEVEADADARLLRLAAGTDDPRHVALVEAPPPSGFTGVPGNDATTIATFVVDEPERIVLELRSPEPGFLFLADQYFPGWSATVNDRPAPIMRANHAFRIVEVPGGPVTVEFRYHSALLWPGVIITVATWAVLATGVVRRRCRAPEPAHRRNDIPRSAPRIGSSPSALGPCMAARKMSSGPRDPGAAGSRRRA